MDKLQSTGALPISSSTPQHAYNINFYIEVVVVADHECSPISLWLGAVKGNLWNRKKKSNALGTTLAIGLVFFLLGGGFSIFKGVFGPKIMMVHRETHLDEYKQYVVVQELQNVGRAGTGRFVVEQNGRIVCQHHIFLNKGERRTISVECPAMRDGISKYRVET